MDNSKPLVTIVIPCYNHEQFVKDTIQSVIDQSYENIELIIIDDGSKDDSVLKIQEMAALCAQRFVRFEFRSRSNKGLSPTLNEALEWSNGDYWTTCSSDDYYHKDKIQSQVDFFLKNKDYKFCITQSYVVNDLNQEIYKETILYNKGIENNISFNDIFLFKIHLPVTAMYDKYFLYFSVGGYDSSLSAEDYDINLRVARQTEIGVVLKKLYYYRSPKAEGIGRKRLPMRMDVSESHLKTIKKYKKYPEYNNALLEWNFRRFIYYSAYTNTKIYALKGMIKSYRKIKSIYYSKALFRLIFYWKMV